MEKYTKIQISAKTYWGFSIDIPDRRLVGMNETDIVEEIKSFMKIFFSIHNLEDLKEGIANLNLHIHQDIVPGKTIYVCSHD